MVAAIHQCFKCGMSYDASETHCPKCDFGRFEQNRGQQFSVDIAHNRQTVETAVQQFYSALEQAGREQYSELEIIVGGGLINREIASTLEAEVWKGSIRSFRQEPHNRGAYILKL